MTSKLLWYAARSNGLVAWGLLAAAVLWGLALSTRAFRSRPRPAWQLDLHRFLGAAALVFTAIHVVTILLDTYVHFGLVEVLVPLAGAWHPVAVAWGVAALYLLVAVEVTSLLRARLPKRVWRSTHYMSFVLFALASAHGLSAGTDRHTTPMRVVVFTATAAIVVLTAVRIARTERHDVMGSPPVPDLSPAPDLPPVRHAVAVVGTQGPTGAAAPSQASVRRRERGRRELTRA